MTFPLRLPGARQCRQAVGTRCAAAPRTAALRANAYAFRVLCFDVGRIVDRIDEIKVFVAVLDEASLAGAGRKLGKSPSAVRRAIAFLEAHVGPIGITLLARFLKQGKSPALPICRWPPLHRPLKRGFGS